jgi:hypothetical protein
LSLPCAFWASRQGTPQSTGITALTCCTGISDTVEIEHLSQSAQASILSLLQDNVLTETKVSKTRSIEFQCSIFATCNSIKKLKEPLVSRFMVIEMKSYSQEEFIEVVLEQLKKRGIAENFGWFIASEVWKARAGAGGVNANIRECVRLANLCRDEDDVIKMLGIVKGS